MLYVMNALIIPVDFELKDQFTVVLKKIDIETAKRLLESSEFVSAIGHQATASVLSQLLGIEIPFNRITVRLKPGDMCIHFALKTRLPEGVVLNEEELRKLDYDLVFSKVIC